MEEGFLVTKVLKPARPAPLNAAVRYSNWGLRFGKIPLAGLSFHCTSSGVGPHCCDSDYSGDHGRDQAYNSEREQPGTVRKNPPLGRTWAVPPHPPGGNLGGGARHDHPGEILTGVHKATRMRICGSEFLVTSGNWMCPAWGQKVIMGVQAVKTIN